MKPYQQSIFELLLPTCPFLVVNRRHEGVVLHSMFDAFLQHDRFIVLQVGRDPNVVNIQNLQWDHEGWSGVLSMKGALSEARIPWSAIVAMWDNANTMHVQWDIQDKAETKPAISKSNLRIVNNRN